MHRSPGGVTCEASSAVRRDRFAGHRYPPAMRRWVCVVALLAGFVRDADIRGFRLREPVAIERLIDASWTGEHGLRPTGAWWARPTG